MERSPLSCQTRWPPGDPGPNHPHHSDKTLLTPITPITLMHQVIQEQLALADVVLLNKTAQVDAQVFLLHFLSQS